MGTKTESWISDIEFVLAECNRIADMGKDVFKFLPKEEALYSLPHPSGRGMMICGREAAARVARIAEEAGHRANLSRRVTQHSLRRPTEELLVQRFVRERRELDTRQIDRFMATVGRKARARCTDITHFVPCYLMTAQEPDALQVGPVVFHSRVGFRRMMLALVKGYGKGLEPEARKHVRGLMADTMAFYRQFDWVAEVTVQGCDSETSAEVAERAVTSALDCLHLIFRARYTYKMRVGGPAMRRDRRAGLTLDEDGKLHAKWSVSLAGQVNFPEGWSKYLKDPEVAHLLSLCGQALEVAVNPDLTRPLSRRFLDAAQWFGEASRDDRPATRIVKYVTALERMVMTDEMDDIAMLLSERVAALCCDRTDAADREKWRMDARKIYNLRSRLVHGSMSPSDRDIRSGDWTAARLGEHTLLNSLARLGVEGLTEKVVSTKRLARWYGRVVAMIDDVQRGGAGGTTGTD